MRVEESWLSFWLTLAALGTSVLSAIVGMAGGATLLAFMKLSALAHATVIGIHAAVQLTSNTARSVAYWPHIAWAPVSTFVLAAIPGPIAGLWLLEHLHEAGARALIGFLLLYVVFGRRGSARMIPLRPAIQFPVAGALSGLLGVSIGAVGPVVAPFFLQPEFSKETVIGTKAVCQAAVHLIKLAALAGLYPLLLHTAQPEFSLGLNLQLVVPMASATILGTFIGRSILHRVSEAVFVRLYRGVLTVLAFKLIIDGIRWAW